MFDYRQLLGGGGYSGGAPTGAGLPGTANSRFVTPGGQYGGGSIRQGTQLGGGGMVRPPMPAPQQGPGGFSTLDLTPQRPRGQFAAPGAGPTAPAQQAQGGLAPVMSDPMSYWNQRGYGGGPQQKPMWGWNTQGSSPMAAGPAGIQNSNQLKVGPGQYGATDSFYGGGFNSGGGGGGAAPRMAGGGGAVNRLGYGPQATPKQPAGNGGIPTSPQGNTIADQLQKYTDETNQANNDRYNQLLGMAGQLSDAGMQREQRREDAGMGRVAQQSISAGLGNTTILPTLQRGIQDDSALRQEQVADQGLRTKMGIVERRTDLPPDYGLLASLAARPGAASGVVPSGFGGGGFGGMPSFGGHHGSNGQNNLQNALAPSRGGPQAPPTPPQWQQAINGAAGIANDDTDAADQWAQEGGDPWDQMASDGGAMAAAGQDAASQVLNPPQVPFVGATPQQGFNFGSSPPSTVAPSNPIDYAMLLQKMMGMGGGGFIPGMF